MKILKLVLMTSFLICSVLILSNPVTSENVTSNIVYVNTDGSANFTTITEALENVDDGDTIFVYNGIYFSYRIINYLH